MADALGATELLNLYRSGVFNELDPGFQGTIESDREAGEVSWELDSFLQFSLLDDVSIPSDLLDVTEATVRAGWDPELTERTLGWIAKHRQRNQAA